MCGELPRDYSDDATAGCGTGLLIGICHLWQDCVTDWIMLLAGPNCWVDLYD